MRVKLGTKLTAIFLILSILPTLILGTYAYRQTFNVLKTKEIEKIDILLNGIVSNTQLTIQDTEFLLKNLSATPSFITYLHAYNQGNKQVDPKLQMEANKALRKIFVDSMGYYASIMILGPGGEIVADSLGSTGYSLGLGELEFAKESMKNRRFTMSPVYYSSLSQTGVKLPTLSMAYPIIQGTGQVLGSIVITFDFRNFNRTVQNTEIGEMGFGYMLNIEGVLLSHPDSGKVLESAKDEISIAIINGVQEENAYRGIDHIKADSLIWSYFYHRVPSTDWIIVFTLPEKEYLVAAKGIQINTLMIIIFAVLFAVISAIVFVRYFTKNIYQMVDVMKKVAKGDFTVQSVCGTKDELLDLSNSINEMVNAQGKVLTKLLVTSDGIEIAGKQMMESTDYADQYMEEIAATAQEFLSTAEESRNAVNEINNKIEDVTNKGNQVKEISSMAVEKSNITQQTIGEGLKSTEMAMLTMLNIENSIDKTAEDVSLLVEASEKIYQFIDYIKGISRETNLLALNASIEAARAGEYGRGFSVVAEEVRKLSQQSDEAAHNVTSIVTGVIKGIDAVRSNVKETQKQSVLGKEASQRVKASFNRINEAINEVSQMVHNNNGAIREQMEYLQEAKRHMKRIDDAINYILANAKQIADGTQEQSSTINEITEVAHQLNDVARDLTLIASNFKITHAEDISEVSYGEDSLIIH